MKERQKAGRCVLREKGDAGLRKQQEIAGLWPAIRALTQIPYVP